MTYVQKQSYHCLKFKLISAMEGRVLNHLKNASKQHQKVEIVINIMSLVDLLLLSQREEISIQHKIYNIDVYQLIIVIRILTMYTK